ncbi:hypothetical protein GCM10027418_19160 [Mariniluteicoccus endophyticus]
MANEQISQRVTITVDVTVDEYRGRELATEVLAAQLRQQIAEGGRVEFNGGTVASEDVAARVQQFLTEKPELVPQFAAVCCLARGAEVLGGIRVQNYNFGPAN